MEKLMRLARHILAARAALATLATLAGLAAAPQPAQAWVDYQSMLNQQMQLMNQNINRGLQMQQGVVQQRMQDPQVRAGYQRYLQQMQSAGRAPMDFATYTYYYIYTNGFSSQGMAHMQRTEAGIQQQQRQGLQGLRDAEARRRDAQQQQRDHYSHNQQEAGRGLMGQSTYHGYGAPRVLPHTWQPNTSHRYQGQIYRVDEGGRYFVLGPNGSWYPIQR
jgi:hypothetical protein